MSHNYMSAEGGPSLELSYLRNTPSAEHGISVDGSPLKFTIGLDCRLVQDDAELWLEYFDIDDLL